MLMTVDNFDLVQKLLALPYYNLILISLLIIPLFIGAWVTLLSSLNITLSETQKRNLALFIIAIYSVGLIIGKIGHDNAENKKFNQVASILERDIKTNAPQSKVMGFKRIIFKHPKFDKELFFTIEEKFPEKFEIVVLTDTTDPAGLHLLE
jgi:hypothetical protein